MHWLVTVAKGLDADTRDSLLKDLSAVAEEPVCPIPVDEGEVLAVEGPADLPDRAKGVPGVLEVHPSSELTLY